MTDILKDAQCISIDDRVYRFLPIRDSFVETVEEKQSLKTYLDDDDDFDPDLPIMHLGHKFYISFHIPKELIGIVVGTRGKNVQALEQQNDVKVDVPQRNSDGVITVTGSTKKAVSLSYRSITNKVIHGRFTKESRHFISLPINSANIQQSFLKFKEEVLAKYKGTRGIDASIFQKPCKLHVTVSLLVLLDERDNQNAIALLAKCKNDVLKELGEKEFIVKVKGIEYMNDDPAEVDVLYAKLQELDDDDSLQIIADKIMNEFVEANLSRRQYDKVKLHITLMNTLFRDNLESKEDHDSPRVTFDARPILKDYSDYDFGETVISQIHISVRYTESSDGYYTAIHKMKLNS